MTTNAWRTLMLALMCATALLLAGCGGGDDDAQKAAPAAEATAETATEAATDAAVQMATHDCDGGCGMKAVPMDQHTVIDAQGEEE